MWKDKFFAVVDRSQVRKNKAEKCYSPSKTQSLLCENSLRNVRPHASLVFSLLCSDRALEMGHPRFTGRVRGFISLGPLGTIFCLDLACKENSHSSNPDPEMETSKHEGGSGKQRCKERRDGRKPPLVRATRKVAVLAVWEAPAQSWGLYLREINQNRQILSNLIGSFV